MGTTAIKTCEPGIPGPHHWVIEEAQGPTSSGTCQLCGDVRDHTNSVEGGDYKAAGVILFAAAQHDKEEVPPSRGWHEK